MGNRILLALLLLALGLGLLWWLRGQRDGPPKAPPPKQPKARKELSKVTFSGVDAATGGRLPLRITLRTQEGNPAAFRVKPSASLVARPRFGLLYTLGQPVTVTLPRGRYVFYATRGMEWGLGKRSLDLRAPGEHELRFSLRREVDTRGYLALDTHIHTKTFSGHGNIDVAERTVTIAGEGIELAAATDHNAHVDYRSYQKQTGTTRLFRPLIGNEVGSLEQGQRGHISIFPLKADAHVPHSEFRHWRELAQELAKSQTPLAILNHPRWPLSPQGGPLGSLAYFGFNRLSGGFPHSSSRRFAFPFHAMELLNADTAVSKRKSRPLYLLKDWFALLNHGRKLAAVAGSDSHSALVPVGHARTYVPSASDDPFKADMGQVVQAIKAGRCSLSMGIFATLKVDGKAPGERASFGKKKALPVEVRVASASWIQPRELLLFANGRELLRRPIPTKPDEPTRWLWRGTLQKTRYDAHLVAVVLGDGVSQVPHWMGELMRYEKYSAGITNPVYLDADGDGRYSSLRHRAEAMLKAGGGAKAWLERLRVERFDLGIQLLSALRRRWGHDDPRFQRMLQKASALKPPYQAYARSLEKR